MPTDSVLFSKMTHSLHRLENLCCYLGPLGNAIVENYQPVDCNGDPVGPPINVMATISVAKNDVAICNTTELAQAIADAINLGSADLWNVPTMIVIPVDSTYALTDLGLDVTKLHSIDFSVITGTVDIDGDLGGGSQVAAGLPVGVNGGWTATTVWGTGDIEFTTDKRKLFW